MAVFKCPGCGIIMSSLMPMAVHKADCTIEDVVKEEGKVVERPKEQELLAVWWTSQADCEKIGEPVHEEDVEDLLENNGGRFPPWAIRWGDLPMPNYIKKEYSSRLGRAGRGRLWIPPGITLEGGIKWGEGEVYDRALQCGGIVFYMKDAEQICKLPGFVTDVHMIPIEWR